MSLTVAQYLERVYLRVSRGLPEFAAGIMRTACEASLPDALQSLGARVARSDDQQTRAQLQKTFPFVLSSGDAAFPAGLYPESLGVSRLTHPSYTEPGQYLPNIQDLTSPPPLSDYFFYSTYGAGTATPTGNLRCVDYTGAALTGTVTGYASYIPSLSDSTLPMPDTLSDDLVDEGAVIVTSALTTARAS
jgi:hypothetical protein